MPKTYTISYVDYHELVDQVEAKYGVSIRDYATHQAIKASGLQDPRGTIMGEAKAYMEFKGFDPETWRDSQDKDWAYSSELSLMKLADEKAGIWTDVPRIPYQDFWHYILDCIEVNQGAIHTMNFADFRDGAEEDWQKEIAQMFVDEFGDEDLQVMIDW